MSGGRVAWLAGVDDGHLSQGSGQDQGGGQACGASADHHHVVFVHATRVAVDGGRRQRLLPIPGTARWNGRCDDDAELSTGPPRRTRGGGSGSAVAQALEGVPARLRRVREQRGLTLTQVAEQAGLSKSTLSRLETGQRRPSLELLLPLAQVYRVPIDDLVGAPDVADPRIRLKPRRLNGRTVLPLTRPGGVQAWKIIVPVTQTTPNPRAHDGFEWLYVLSGRMRLVLGDQDLVLGVGEAAEFDTRVPHWFGSTGDGPAEVLSIFGRPGERMQVRPAGGDEPQAAPGPARVGGAGSEGAASQGRPGRADAIGVAPLRSNCTVWTEGSRRWVTSWWRPSCSFRSVSKSWSRVVASPASSSVPSPLP